MMDTPTFDMPIIQPMLTAVSLTQNKGFSVTIDEGFSVAIDVADAPGPARTHDGLQALENGVMRALLTRAVLRFVSGHWFWSFTCIGHTTDHFHPQLSEAAHAGDGTCAAARQTRHPTPLECVTNCDSLPAHASVSSLHAVTSSVDTRLQLRARHDITLSSPCSS